MLQSLVKYQNLIIDLTLTTTAHVYNRKSVISDSGTDLG